MPVAESVLKNLIVIPPMERRQNPDLSTVAIQLGQMQSDIGGMKDAVKEMTQAITRLAVVEERMAQGNQQQNRAFEMIGQLQLALSEQQKEHRKELKAVEERTEALEKSMPIKELIQKGAVAATWAILCAVGIVVGKKVGLL